MLLALVDALWWVGFVLSVLGLFLLALTTVFNLQILPSRYQTYLFWLAVGVFIMGLSLTVVFT